MNLEPVGSKITANQIPKKNNSLNQSSQESTNDGKIWYWVPCKKDLFKPAYLIEESSTSIRVQSNITETFAHSEVFKMNPAKFDKVCDLAFLSHLNEPSVLHNLRNRFFDSMIYSYSGLFLIALNPYKSLGIYTDQIKKEFLSIKSREGDPHIFSVASEAYMCMLNSRSNQSILITGESGAGKTENTKKVIEYLVYASSNSFISSEQNETAQASKVGSDSIDSLLLTVNPILEAFGNAKTVKNDNSSRFGKFIQMKFKGGNICGARIEKYLLEKSRVTFQNPGERSYHIFYYLLKGASESLLRDLHLTRNPADYRCIANSVYSIPSIDDAAEFQKLNDYFTQLNTENPLKYYKMVAAVLHLGNIVFHETDDKVFISDLSSAEKACKLLNICITSFLKEVLHPTIMAGSELVTHYRSVTDCYKVVEGLMKLIYDSMFENLVFEINSILDKSYSDNYIGVLDIAGFEIFEKNSFEQLCINYTNEKLQQFFNHHMFILEQEIYKSEHIDWNFIDFGLDLEPTIHLIEGNNPIGILSYLDEECVMPQADENTLLNKIKSIKGVEKCPFTDAFKIKHYAGPVEYEVKGWLDKNKDIYSDSLKKLVASQFETMSADKNVKKGIFRTVSQSHRENLKRLMDMLKNTNPHFVRCILPNLEKSPDIFDKSLILNQLRCNGVLEGIRISRLGYPTRISYNDFNARYSTLLEDSENFIIDKELSQAILKSLNINTSEYRLGNTMVFLRQGVLADIENLREKKVAFLAGIIQSILKIKIEARKNSIEQERNETIRFLQTNAKFSLDLLKWKWWSLFIRIKLLLDVKKNEDFIKEKEEQIKQYSELVEKEREEKRRLDYFTQSLQQSLEEEKKTRELEEIAHSETRSLVDGLRLDNSKLKQDLSQHEKKISDLKQQVSKALINENALSAQVKKLTEDFEQSKLELANKNEIVEKMIHKDGSLNNILNAKEDEIKRLNSLIANLNSDINDLKLNLVKSEEANLELTQLNAKNESNLAALEEKQASQMLSYKKLKQDLDDANFEIETLQCDIRKKNIIVEENNRQINSIKQEIEYFKSKNQNLEQNLAESRNKVESLEATVKTYTDQNEDKDETLISLQKQVKTLNLKITTLEGMYEDAKQEKDDLYLENQKLAREKIEALCALDIKDSQEKKALQNEIQKLRADNEKLKAYQMNSASSSDEGMDSLVSNLRKQVDFEKSQRKTYEKKVSSLETDLAISENKVRELILSLEQSDERIKEMMSEYSLSHVPKQEVSKLKDQIDNLRNGLNSVSEMFMKDFFSILTQKQSAIDELVNNVSELKSMNQDVEAKSQLCSELEQMNSQLKKEINDLLKTNSLMKSDLDTLTVTNIALTTQIEELKSHIKNIEISFSSRESVLDDFKNEYQEKIQLINKKEFELSEKIKKSADLISKLRSADVEMSNERIEALSAEVLELKKSIIAKDSQILALTEQVKSVDDIKSLAESNVEQIKCPAVLEKEILVSTMVVDKEALKAAERKRLIGCNCKFKENVKVVELVKENKDENLKLINENNLLELKIKQLERQLEEHAFLLDSMKGCVSVMKKKSSSGVQKLIN